MDIQKNITVQKNKFDLLNQNSNFHFTMSLLRSSSRKQFSILSEDLAACLDQKNSMIAVLQTEVEQLRFNHQKYDRLQEEVCKTKEKYESSLRNYEITKVTNQQRLESSAKNCLQLKIQVQHLNKEIQIKGQQLKDVKAESQQLLQYSSRREEEVAECQTRGEELVAVNQSLKIQEQRIKSQMVLAREQNQRQRRENVNISKSLQTIKDKCYKTQSYIRNLTREEQSLNQTLTKIEDENNYLDNRIQQLNTVQALTGGEVAQIQKQNQELKFMIASRELQIKRLQKEIKQTTKNITMQKDKTKVVNEQLEQKKNSCNRLENEVRQCSEEINFIMSKNNEVLDVNSQLKSDLKVCEKHLQNVLRINKNMEAELGKFKEANLMAIKKLQQPVREGSSNYFVRSTPRKWAETERMTATGGFQRL